MFFTLVGCAQQNIQEQVVAVLNMMGYDTISLTDGMWNSWIPGGFPLA